MLSLVALLSYATSLTWWQVTLFAALLNMWVLTLLSPHLATEGWKDGVNGRAQRTPSSASSRVVRQRTTGVEVEEDIQYTWLSPGLFDSNSSAFQTNPANGVPMLNSVYDANSNVFGTTWADDQRNHD